MPRPNMFARYLRRDLDGRGILEDEVAMPGGGALPIDDLEAAGALTPDLLRKARPEVWQHMEALQDKPLIDSSPMSDASRYGYPGAREDRIRDAERGAEQRLYNEALTDEQRNYVDSAMADDEGGRASRAAMIREMLRGLR
jgi:hypothetical protein